MSDPSSIVEDGLLNPESAVTYALLSSFADKARQVSQNMVAEDPSLADEPLDSPHRRAKEKELANNTFEALKAQAVARGYVPASRAQDSTFDDMIWVDSQLLALARDAAKQIIGSRTALHTSSGSQLPPAPLALSRLPHPRVALAESSPDAEIASSHRWGFIQKLGSGGFGTVFLATDRLLNKVFAVKEIKLSEKATQRDVEKIVAEIRALVQMSHGNVVRIYSAWTLNKSMIPSSAISGRAWELGSTFSYSCHSGSEATTNATIEDSSIKIDSIPQAREYITDSSESDDTASDESEEKVQNDGSFFIEFTTNSDNGIEFTNDFSSDSDMNQGISIDSSSESDGNYQQGLSSHAGRSHTLQGEENTALQAFHSSRSESYFQSPVNMALIKHPVTETSVDLPVDARFLCYSMDFHPLNLRQFLFSFAQMEPESESHLNFTFANGSYPRFCGHLLPSLQLLSAICDGLGHIHGRNFTHRDVKPENILLSIHSEKPDNASFVELTSCADCRRSERGESVITTTSPQRKNRKPQKLYVVPHVTDFGTVLAMGCREPRPYEVGTLGYTPSDRSPCDKTDVYALGYIMLEMMCHPTCDTERDLIRREKKIPPDHPLEVVSLIENGIAKMTEKDQASRWGMQEVRNWLAELKTMALQNEQSVEL